MATTNAAYCIGGVASLMIDGNNYSLLGNWTVNPGFNKREGKAGQDKVQGYTEMPVVPSIKGDFATLPGLSLTSLSQIVNSTIQLTSKNGTVWVLSNAWCTSAFEVNTQEGRFGIEFQGISCTERSSTTTSTTTSTGTASI